MVVVNPTIPQIHNKKPPNAGGYGISPALTLTGWVLGRLGGTRKTDWAWKLFFVFFVVVLPYLFINHLQVQNSWDN